MHEIPKPELLDPDRVDRGDRENMTAEDHRSRAQLLAKALGESCDYAAQLWDQLNAQRGYLLNCLPPDPRVPGPHVTASASPTGPGDEDGWQNWINAFAGTTSVLCGAHGDSGFGLSRAREEAQLRRTAPELTGRRRPDGGDHDSDPGTLERPPEPASSPDAAGWSPVKMAAAAVVGVLALRGLRSRPALRPDRRT